MIGYFVDCYVNLHWGWIGICVNWTIAILIPLLLSRGKVFRWENAVRIAASIFVMELTGALLYISPFQPLLQPVLGGVASVAISLIGLEKQRMVDSFSIGIGFLALLLDINGISMCIGTLMGHEDFVLQRYMMIFYTVASVGAAAFCRRMSKNGLNEWRLGLLLCAFSIINAGSLAVWKIPSGELTNQVMLFGVAAIVQLAMCCFVYYLDTVLWERQGKQAEKFLRQADENMLSMMNANMETYRKMRHDMGNHYLLMKRLLEQKEYDKLEEYFSQYSNQMIPAVLSINCEHQTIAVILNMELEKANRAGIKLKTNIAVPGNLNIADVDLCSLLINLIDNGIEYVGKHKDQVEQWVGVELWLKRSNLFVCIKNPIRQEDEAAAGRLQTTKPDRQHHGYGSKIARSIVEHYDGTILYSVDQGCFTVDAILVNEGEG